MPAGCWIKAPRILVNKDGSAVGSFSVRDVLEILRTTESDDPETPGALVMLCVCVCERDGENGCVRVCVCVRVCACACVVRGCVALRVMTWSQQGGTMCRVSLLSLESTVLRMNCSTAEQAAFMERMGVCPAPRSPLLSDGRARLGSGVGERAVKSAAWQCMMLMRRTQGSFQPVFPQQ
jgi:hypothetical protein